jgi:hypothetical protein
VQSHFSPTSLPKSDLGIFSPFIQTRRASETGLDFQSSRPPDTLSSLVSCGRCSWLITTVAYGLLPQWLFVVVGPSFLWSLLVFLLSKLRGLVFHVHCKMKKQSMAFPEIMGVRRPPSLLRSLVFLLSNLCELVLTSIARWRNKAWRSRKQWELDVHIKFCWLCSNAPRSTVTESVSVSYKWDWTMNLLI